MACVETHVVHNGCIVGAHCTVVRTGMTEVCSRLELMVVECVFFGGGGGGGALSVADKVAPSAHGMYPATLNIRSVYLNSPSVVTRLLFNICKPVGDSYVNVILPGKMFFI